METARFREAYLASHKMAGPVTDHAGGAQGRVADAHGRAADAQGHAVARPDHPTPASTAAPAGGGHEHSLAFPRPDHGGRVIDSAAGGAAGKTAADQNTAGQSPEAIKAGINSNFERTGLAPLFPEDKTRQPDQAGKAPEAKPPDDPDRRQGTGSNDLPWYEQAWIGAKEAANQVAHRIEAASAVVHDPVKAVEDTAKEISLRYKGYTTGPLPETGPSAAVHAVNDVLNPLAQAKRANDRADLAESRAERGVPGSREVVIQEKVKEAFSLLDAATMIPGAAKAVGTAAAGAADAAGTARAAEATAELAKEAKSPAVAEAAKPGVADHAATASRPEAGRVGKESTDHLNAGGTADTKHPGTMTETDRFREAYLASQKPAPEAVSTSADANPRRPGADTGGPGKGGSNLDDALDGSISRLDKPGNPFQIHGKAGLKELPITMDIDEPSAVGEKGISATEARRRATDVNNRQFLDPATNRRTKYLGTDTHPSSGPSSEVSVTEHPDALLTRRFGQITEMKDVFNEALAKIEDPSKLSPTKLKEAINKNMWDVIKDGTSQSAVEVREALQKLGFENVKGQGYVLRRQHAVPGGNP
jgi:hypothetical protein